MFKIILIPLSLLIIGCTHPQSSNNVLTKPNRVIINNIPLSKKVKITSFSTRYVNNILESYVQVQNLSQVTYDLEYRFKWYDQDKYEVGENLSIWKPLFLDAMDAKKIIGLASTEKAESFKFYIRERQR